MKTLLRKLNQKLTYRFYGPYEVFERIRKVAYKLKLPNSTRVHPDFHVFTADWELLVEPAQVLAW